MARAIVEGRLYSSSDVPADVLPLVFMPIAFGAVDKLTPKQAEKVAVYAIAGVHHTAPRSINGYPMFTECQLCLLADLRKALALAAEALKAQESVLGPAGATPNARKSRR